jgi:hemerythrin-like domain-containing protein
MALKELLGVREGILADLHRDHEAVDKLLQRVLDSDDAAERRELFAQVRAELKAHSEAEAKVLYRKLDKSGEEESRLFAFEGDVEHEVLAEQLDKLWAMRDKSSEKWTARAQVMQELLRHHVKEEESDGFERAHAEFSKEELEKMAERFQREKAKLLEG